MNAPRTTFGLVGDLCAAHTDQRFTVNQLLAQVQRDRTGITDAVLRLKKAEALSSVPDPEDNRRNLVFMTQEQAKRWQADGGASYGLVVDRSVQVPPNAAKAAVASNEAAVRRRSPLRFALWDHGAVQIDGLTRRQLTLPAADTAALAALFSGFPEGALQALCESALKPAFTLHIEGKEHALTPEQTASLVEYIEQLPARALRGPAGAFPGLPRAGSDHRSHRIAGAGDED